MVDLIGIKPRDADNLIYAANIKKIFLNIGEFAIVENSKCVQFGKILSIKKNYHFSKQNFLEEKIVRKANILDFQRLKIIEDKEKNAYGICKKLINEHSLKMKLLNVMCGFDRKKITFYFSSETRVDFRILVKSLAETFRTRIELKQINTRCEAKIVGGLGICGKTFCCSTFLTNFQHVNIKMARDQGLSLTPSKISGACGRLMCCLNFEENMYLDLLKDMPEIGKTIQTSKGDGVIIGYNISANKIKIVLKDSQGKIPINFDIAEIIKN